MVVIFGFGPGKQEDLGEAVQTICPNCHNQVMLHHVRSKKTVRLYFVPVVPYGTDDYLVCPVCSRGMQLSRTQLAHVDPMKRATASFRAGRLSEAGYAAQAELFWRAMGVSVTGQSVPRGGPAAAASAPPTAGPPPPAAPAAPAPRAQAPAGPAQPAGPAAAAQPAPAAEDDTSWLAQLRKLAQLHEEGVLSDAHYETAKRRILGQT
jgi:zinc ribbon protein